MAIGGVVRGPSGGWLVGFKMTVGLIDILQVEAKNCTRSLKLAWDRGFRQIELECDDVMLIEFIWNGWVSVSNVNEIRSIHWWCLKYWEVKFKHV